MKFLIDFHNTASDAQIQAYLATNNCTVLQEYDNFDKVFLVECAVQPQTDAIVVSIQNDDHVTFSPLGQSLEVNEYYMTYNPNLPNIVISTTDNKDWWKNYCLGNPEFEAPTVTISRKGQNVNVYVMDSGLMASHPEFAGANITNLYSVTPGDYNDYNGHGTALSSVIVGATCGITASNLKVVKILDPNHATKQSEVLTALDAILTDYQSRPSQLGVVNCSWIVAKNEYIETKMRELYNAGLLIMAAAGNNGTEIENVTPASMPEALTIGSYNKDLLPSSFSNYSDTSSISYTAGDTNHGELDGWAPGEGIYAATLNGGYGNVAGTSIATAICTAVFAYNISDMIYSDGSHVTYLNHHDLVELTHFTFRRLNMLDLTDPKYATSKNDIATIIDELLVAETSPPNFSESPARVNQLSYIIRLYNPKITSAFEIVDPLPVNWSVSVDGLLTAVPSVSDGPTDGSPYKIHTYHFKRTYNSLGGSLAGTTEDVTAKVYVLSETADINQLIADDPTLNILLQSECSGPFAQQCDLASGGCTDACSGGTYCCGDAKNGLCGCVTGGGGTCFSGETSVTMADGSTKLMKHVRDGDKILAYNFETKTNEENIVEHIHIRTNRDMYEYILNNGTVLTVTDDHPLYVIDKGWCSMNPKLSVRGYKSLRPDLVGKIEVGDKLHHKDGTPVEILDIRVSSYSKAVYTFNNKFKTSPAYYANGVLAY